MKKTIVAAVFASVAAFGLSGVASADYDLAKDCHKVVTSGETPMTEDQATGFCSCIVDDTGGDVDIIKSFEDADGDRSKFSTEAEGVVKGCEEKAAEAAPAH